MSWYAAVIKSYIPDKHRARVEIFGLTDDTSGIYPEAEIAYAIGDSCNDTETLIKPGDAVWVTFGMCGDSRTPIIVAYRNAHSGNTVGTRRIRQKNIEIIATGSITINAPNIKLVHSQLTSTGTNTMQGQTNLDGGATTSGGGAPVITGGLEVQAGSVNHDGSDIGKTHTHVSASPGSKTSTPS